MKTTSLRRISAWFKKVFKSPKIGTGFRNQKGQTISEYAILVALISIGMVVMLHRTVKPRFSRMYSHIARVISDVREDFDGGR